MSHTTNFNKAKNNHRLIIFLLFIAMLGPFIFAYILVQKNNIYQFKLNHHGDLISPVISIFNKQLGEQKLSAKWWLVYVSPEECSLDLTKQFFQMNQIHKALGKNASRLEKLGIINFNCRLEEYHADMSLIKVSKTEYEKFFTYQTGFYLIDPKGNIMMHYDSDIEPKGILSDLKRLLKVSKIG